ncbi:hypothetical protein WG901_07505 [Novosphingobium sp. PS1R-30]|uniref:Uncharacterized protein n=1 Tax=Novosphingobium anseongense TaxID=3133436 RepID=A0ABU8RTR2_9SPHN
MRYFLDAEYNGFGGELISIALVPEDEATAPFYAALVCAAPTPWVAEHVLPMLDTMPVSRSELVDPVLIDPIVPGARPHNALNDATALRAAVLAHERRS